MRNTEDIPKIKVEPKPVSEVATGINRTDKTVHMSDAELGIQPRSEDTKAGFKHQAVDELYSILDKVGDGGMGIVYLAQDKKLGRYVAIKRLNRTSLSNPVLKERFSREAKSVAALNHIHIVHVYALGEDDEGPYIVMEYVPGPPETSPNKTPHAPFTLADRVEVSGPLSVDDALGLLLKICKAIEYAHNCGVIHRDIKPSNVLLDESGEPKLADFGLARRIGQDEEHLTVPGERMLSVGYGAPEQETDASQTDQRADVYGLGAILYFSITGKNPRYFRESEVPESLRMPLVKALETDRNKRWNTVKEFTAALMLVKSPSTIEPPTTIKTTWHCKWCDTINPVTISYCGKCGWDGGETCSECGADTRVGIQFCGACGADAREYEIAHMLLKRMQRHWSEKAFELVIHEAGRSVRFQPTGANGRKLLNQIDSMGRDAHKALSRRKEIRDAIEREMALQNYELVKKYVEEYSSLSTDNSHADLAKELPSLILNANLKKIRKAIEEREWDYAERTCRDIAENNPSHNSEPEFLLRIIKVQRVRIRTINTAAAILFLFIAYILSAAPAYILAGNPVSPSFKSAYKLAYFLHESTVLEKPLEQYALLWGSESMYEKPHEKEPCPAGVAKGGDIESFQSEFTNSMKKIEENNMARIKTWQRNYATELTALQAAMQKKGDFEGWSAARDELLRTEDSPDIPQDAMVTAPQELASLQARFRDSESKNILEKKKEIRSLTQHYVEKLENLQKKMTMQGKMASAATINAEIKRLKTSLDAEPDETSKQPNPQPKNTPK